MSESESEVEEDESGDDEFSEFMDDSDESDMVIEGSKDIISAKLMMRLFQDHPMQESFQLCCQWLMSSKDLIKEIGGSGGENSNHLHKHQNTFTAGPVKKFWGRITIFSTTKSSHSVKLCPGAELEAEREPQA